MVNTRSSFPERLEYLRRQNGWTQAFAAMIFDVKQGSYANWENGTRQPKIEKIIEIADKFGVSTDYLLGITSENFKNGYESTLRKEFESKNFLSLANYREEVKELVALANQLADDFKYGAGSREALLDSMLHTHERFNSIEYIKSNFIVRHTHTTSLPPLFEEDLILPPLTEEEYQKYPFKKLDALIEKKKKGRLDINNP